MYLFDAYDTMYSEMVLFIICSLSLSLQGCCCRLLSVYASIKFMKPRSGVPELFIEVLLFPNTVHPWVSNPTHPTT